MEWYHIVLIVGVIVVIWVIATSNTFRQLEIKIEEAFSGIDVAFEKRYDLLTNMMNTAKGYAKHERETFGEVVQYRKGMSVAELSDANQKVTEGFEKIMVLAENYPELKSDKVFMNLQDAITDAEEHLQAARRVYNSNVSIYNQKVVTFPNVLIAGVCHAAKKDFFKAEESKRRNVELNF